MKPVSLADITYEQGLQLLVLRKMAMDEGRIRRMTPEALANTFTLFDVGCDFSEKAAFSLDPDTQRALLTGLAGTCLGAAAGIGNEFITGRRRYAKGALLGGVTGGALGAGLGSVKPEHINSLKEKFQQFARPSAASAKPSAKSLTADQAHELAMTAQSVNPEIAAASGLAATGFGAYQGAKALRNAPSYDPELLRDKLWHMSQTRMEGGAPGQLEYSSMVPDLPSGLPSAATPRKPSKFSLVHPLISEQGFNNAFDSVPGNKTDFWGNMPQITENKIKTNGLGLNPDDFLSNKLFSAQSKKIRPGRAILPAIGVGLATAAIHNILSRYAKNTGERASAIAQLSQAPTSS